MRKLLLGKCGEMALKGLNRRNFEDQLLKNIRNQLKGHLKSVAIHQSAIYMEPEEDANFYHMLDKAKKVFGLKSVSVVYETEKDIEIIKTDALSLLKDKLNGKSFKVEAKRADKTFPLNSPAICREVGGFLHDNIENVTVNVQNPDIQVMVEVREKGVYIYFEKEECHGGLPVGTGGRGVLLLSGGIDSPVAGFMMAKRGLKLEAVHFYSYPYTSERAKQKVISLARIIAQYTGPYRLHIVPFTEIQLKIQEKCREDMMTLVMRRFMMKISERVAQDNNCGALITGESLGQVASQTIEGLTVTNSAVEIPVFRPLIGMDKTEITEISRKMEAFETSILPYEDCCTVFTPKHPKLHPRVKDVIFEEQKLDMEALIEEAVANIERVHISAEDL